MAPGRTEWTTLAMISGDSRHVSDGAQPIVRSVTRMAVSADSKWLAFVAEPGPAGVTQAGAR